jgi:acetyltransferase-like isoleucine patch superfamily enzyme
MISKLAVVETDRIGKNVQIAEFSVIRDGVVLGDNVIVHPHVVIEPGVIIGNDVEIFPGTYVGKTPKGVGATVRQITFESRVLIGDCCAIGPNVVIFYDVTVGNNTLIGDGASLREGVQVGNHCLLSRHVTVNYNSKIGNHTRIMDLTHITGNCEVGDNVFISVLVSTTNDNVVITREYEEGQIKGPCVQNGATVGAGACLLPGVVIGEGAFVGANAVVTKDVQPYDLVIGIPARATRSLRSAVNE